MNILLVCAAGMSTSLLVNNMKKAADEVGLEANIEAHPVSQAGQYGPTSDVILLGPQVRFELNKLKTMYPGKPIDMINMQDYGRMDGKKVLETALKLINE